MPKRVAVIGAGPAGLAALKAAIEEGLEPIAFEAKTTKAGLWCGQQGLVWSSLQANLSKFSCVFSDFPHADETSLFPRANEMASYLAAYETHFNLSAYIRYGAAVQRVEQSGNAWRVTVREGDQTAETLMFDAVIVATGFFSRPLAPKGITIGGRVSHASSYRGPAPFTGKRVLVIGSAFSGCDIAAEIATTAVETAIMVRRPSWYIPRMIGSGKRARPLDLSFYSRAAVSGPPQPDKRRAAHNRHAYFTSLAPDQDTLHPRLAVPDDGESAPVVVTDTFPNAVRNRSLRVVGPDEIDVLQECSPSQAGSNFDAVVLATGYAPNLDYLPSPLLAALSFDAEDALQPLLLGKTVFPPGIDSLAFVGMYRGPYFGTIELQARWACAVIAESSEPLTESEMADAIVEESAIRMQNPRPQFPHPDYVLMSDAIASRLKVLPHIDPANPAHNVLHAGPLLPAHYRLEGRHAASGVANREIERVQRYLESLTE